MNDRSIRTHRYVIRVNLRLDISPFVSGVVPQRFIRCAPTVRDIGMTSMRTASSPKHPEAFIAGTSERRNVSLCVLVCVVFAIGTTRKTSSDYVHDLARSRRATLASGPDWGSIQPANSLAQTLRLHTDTDYKCYPGKQSGRRRWQRVSVREKREW